MQRLCAASKGGVNDLVNRKAFIEQTILPMIESDDSKEKFFRLAMEASSELVSRYLQARDGGDDKEVVRNNHMSSPYALIDAYSLLIDTLVNLESKGTTTLNTALNSITKHIKQQASVQAQSGPDMRPHFRLLSNLIMDLTRSSSKWVGKPGIQQNEDHNMNERTLQVLITLKEALDTVKPQVVPAFAFSWLELISSKHFMPLLLNHKQRGWGLFERLLVDMLSFLNPYLQASSLSESSRVLYKGTLRVLLVLLHDFPEFLCDYHFSLCDVIPPNCIQLRNLVLFAFPHSMRLPDPFTLDLKVDKLPEMGTLPNVLSDFTAALARNNLKANLDNHLKSRAPASVSKFILLP